jgi:hypothetical protein
VAVSPERKAYLKKWRQTEKCKEYQRNYQREYCKSSKYKEQVRQHLEEFPWLKHLRWAQSRCSNSYCLRYKGIIKCVLTPRAIKKLWFRDKASLLSRPSLDRVDEKGDYCYTNCRFIELAENQAQGGAHKKGKHYIKYADFMGIPFDEVPGEPI